MAQAVVTVLGVVALGATGLAVAAPSPADPTLETITVYAKRLTPVARVAASVTVIDQAEIARLQANDIMEMGRYEPGLTVRNDPFRFGLDTIAVRGLGGNRVAVEIDGVPAASGFAVGNFADSGRSFVDLAFVERVEFLRGPASSLYGSDAIGGIVAMTTLRPSTLLSQGNGSMALRTETGYADVDESWHADAIAAAQAPGGEVLLGYVRREGHQPDTAADVKPDPRQYTSDAAMFKYVVDAMPGGPLTVAAEGERVRQKTAVDAFLLQPGRFVNTTQLDGSDALQRNRVSLDQSLQAVGPFAGVDWRVYWQGTSTSQDTFEIRRAAPPRTPPLQILRMFDFDERTLGAEVTAVQSLRSARLDQDFVYGIEAATTRIEERRDGQQTNRTTGATTNVILGESFPLRDLPVTDLTEIGVFVQDELSAPDSRWTVVPALRVDYYDLTPRADRTYREDNPHSTAVGLNEVSFAPKLGVTYRFTDTLNGFVQYAHGFRSPPPEDVNIGLELPLFNVRAIPNPDLKPEKSDGFEVGMRWTTSAVNVTGSVYYNRYREFIESKVNLGVDPASGVTMFQSQNVSRARIYGAELSVVARASEWAPSLAGWSGRLSASWARGTDLVQHEPLNSVDPPSAVAGLRFDAPSRRWGSEFVVTGVAPKRAVDNTPTELYATDGYVTVDWLANVDFGHGLSLNAGVYNLTDAEYIEWSDVRGRAATDLLVPYYTRPGRNAAVTLHWSF